MKHYCNPMNLEYRYQFFHRPAPDGKNTPYKVYREAADPTLVLFRDTYFLFPSMTAGFFTSDDLLHWKFYELGDEIPVYDYAPDVRVMGEYLYFSASARDKNCSFYRTKDPRTEKFEEIEGTFPFWDPNLFIDDDQRVYFYWGCSNLEPIYGVELDPETMQPLSEKKIMICSREDERGYERFGEEHIAPKTEEQIEAEVSFMFEQMKMESQKNGTPLPMPEDDILKMLYGYMGNKPYIEGAWMTKYKGKYYLQYAIPGTEYNVYGNGYYVSDCPLGPFRPGKNNPFSYKPGGFITGAGHGSTLEDKKGEFWHIASMRISHNENFERRIGLWKAGFDADGELFCDQRFGDWPVRIDAKPFEKPDWMLLSYNKKVRVSSGSGAEHVTDEDIRTFWKAEHAASGEWAEIDLGKEFMVYAVQLNFQDDGILLDLPDGQMPKTLTYEERWIDRIKQKTQWKLEGSLDGTEYFMIEDKYDAETDYSHDYLEMDEGIRVRFVRLTVNAQPYGAAACVSGIRIFGTGMGDSLEKAPKKAENVRCFEESEMDIRVSWEQEKTASVNVLWGHHPEKLYHSRMVYGKTEITIGAIVKDEPVYVRVDTFNEYGITEGDTTEVRK